MKNIFWVAFVVVAVVYEIIWRVKLMREVDALWRYCGRWEKIFRAHVHNVSGVSGSTSGPKRVQ